MLLRSAVFMSIIMLLGCGKPDLGPDGEERKSTLSSEDVIYIGKCIDEQEAAIKEAGLLKPKAQAGDLAAATRWRILTGEGPDDLLSPDRRARKVLDHYKAKEVVKAKVAQLQSMRLRMRDLGWDDIRPTWTAAKLGDAVAQNEIHDFFAQKSLKYDRRARKKKDYDWWISENVEFRDIQVLTNPCRQLSYSYLVDAFWTPPAGMWDPFYVEGRYRYDGIEFTPRDWLVKAAVSDVRYRAKLAAVDFISAKDEDARLVAAKALLALSNINEDYEGRALVESCLAAIYCRGIAVQADLAKAAQIMLSSCDNALKARGVKLVCENNLPGEVDGRPYGRADRERVGRAILYAVCNQYGYGEWKRDYERAYFEYWLCLRDKNGGDVNFARRGLDELERRLSPDEVVSLQKKCWIWAKKFDWESPYIDDWNAR